MAVLALVGITGMYLSQIRRNGVLGLVGYVLLAAGYLLIMCSVYAAAYVRVVLSLMPDAFYRLLALPNGIAMIGLGYSLWRTTGTSTPLLPSEVTIPAPRQSPSGDSTDAAAPVPPIRPTDR